MYPPARLWYPLLSRRSLTSNDRRCRANSLFGSDADDVFFLTAAGAAKEDGVMNFDGVYVTARHSLFSASPRPVPPASRVSVAWTLARRCLAMSAEDRGPMQY
ncbi:hypothetical protein PGT21_008442 [Puccinia graminis f. sp. tritici]|uniref:Uncharacterized protein n=1 Tax=Puccinia graminis f. sp. tritici TaxID=56615 RepID=A0A5B0QAT1_PUCGR|nr:hypothetical protein PGT21_008442 [Puccinia graminis f. sp. tritici]